MDTDKCNALLRALELGSLSAAADDLGYTPSGISRMMASLEAEIGFPLIARSRDGIRMTPECEQMLPHFRELVRESSRTMELAESLCGIESGTVRIGIYYPAFYRPLSRLIADFSARFPKIEIDLLQGTSSELAAMVEDRMADFCIISRREGNFDWMPLLHDPMVALVPAHSHLAEEDSVSLGDLKNESFIRMYPDIVTDGSTYLKQNNIDPNIRFVCHNKYAAYQMVGAGLGIALDNAAFTEEYLPLFAESIKVLPLETSYIVPIGIATPKKEHRSPAAGKFIGMSAGYFAAKDGTC